MATTTTTIHVYNSVAQQTSNVVLMFLQPVMPEDDYVYSAWNVLNPIFGSYQQVELSTSFSASVAAFGSGVFDYTNPVGLPLGTAVLVTNPNEQNPVIGGTGTALMTPDQVGLTNMCTQPDTDLSVIWYVNGNKVVETNNTPATTLNFGMTSTFQLIQSVWVMFSQLPETTATYTAQTFGQAVEIPIPNGAIDVYIEAYTDNGIDTFRPISESEFNALARQSSGRFGQA